MVPMCKYMPEKWRFASQFRVANLIQIAQAHPDFKTKSPTFCEPPQFQSD